MFYDYAEGSLRVGTPAIEHHRLLHRSTCASLQLVAFFSGDLLLLTGCEFIGKTSTYVLVLAIETSTFNCPRDKAMFDVHGYAISKPCKGVLYSVREDRNKYIITGHIIA